MINLIRYFYRYSSLLYTLRIYINNYKQNGMESMIVLDKLIDKITSCGSVAIKFCEIF